MASHYLTSCDTLDIYETVINGNGGVGLSIVQLEQHIKVIGFTITNCSSGIYYGGQDGNWRYDLYFSNLRLVGNSSHGINGYLWRTGNYLLNSVVSDNGSHGIRMVNKGALYIGECLVENNQGHGISGQCGFLAACSKIRNNNGDGIIPHIGGQVSGNIGASYRGMLETAFTLVIRVRKASTIAPLLTMESTDCVELWQRGTALCIPTDRGCTWLTMAVIQEINRSLLSSTF